MKTSHKTKVLLIVIAALSGLFATQANAILLTVGDNDYIGLVNDGIPSNEANEVLYVNSLLDLSAGASPTDCSLANSETCDRISSTLDVTGFEDAILGGSLKDESQSSTGIDVTGWTYLLAKYDARDAGSLVWYVGGLNESVDIQASLGGKDVSHYTLFRAPEPTPLVLLGVGFLGLGLMRVIKRA